MGERTTGEAVRELTTHHRTMKTDEAHTLYKDVKQEGDITVTEKDFWCLSECGEIQKREQAARAIPGSGAQDRSYRWVFEHSGQLTDSRSICPGKKAMAVQGMRP